MIKNFSADEILPERSEILKSQGMPPEIKLKEKHETMIARGLDIFMEMSAPAGITGEISIHDFRNIYQGEGKNECPTPLEEIFPRADNMALFAVTLGEKISQKIAGLFDSNEFALGTVLDAAASLGADKSAELLEGFYFKALAEKARIPPSSRTLRYSPGYCGWHLSGQKKLFEALHPEDIGITLNKSFLMQPLKSVSGVIICGKKEIHKFSDTYRFCSRCSYRTCRERMY